jgi:hypothetical protein
MARSGAGFALLVGGSLAIGTVGYHLLAELEWVDAVLNASMILTGMGPVSPLPSAAAKIFASAYALFSGVVFLVACGIVLAPLLHRFLHRFHIDVDDGTPSLEAGTFARTRLDACADGNSVAQHR